MYISNLKIQNYRNFQNFEVDLKPFTLIIGENNIGKTNLLNAIGLILSPDISFYQKRILEIEDINHQRIRTFQKQVVEKENFIEVDFPEVRVDIIFEGMNLDQKAIVNDWLISSEVIGEKAQITYLYAPSRRKELEKWFENLGNDKKEENIDLPVQYYRYSLFGGNDETNRIDFTWLNFLKMEFLDALRDAKRHLLSSSKNTLLYTILHAKVLAQETTEENPKRDIDVLKETLSGLKNIFIQDTSVFKSIQKDIETLLKKISGEEENGLIKLEFVGVNANEILTKLSLIYGSEPISIERNGLGRNNLLYISLLLSQLMQDADKKTVYFRLIGIEEPEAHLYPNLQIHLSRNINDTNEERQILITSHSTHITSQLDLENTIILYKEQNRVIPYYLFNDSIPRVSKRYLKKYLDATKSTMFFARKIILVEGISEQLIIPEFFKIFSNGKTLEKSNIVIVNVQGVAMKHFLEVIKTGYFIKCLVFTDSDDNTRADSLKEKYKDLNDIILIQKSETYTYETDLISENTTGIGKEILLEALLKTRPQKGKELKEELGDEAIEVNKFFENIYRKNDNGKVISFKADFAVNLCEVLQDEDFKDKISEFTMPDYIIKGLEFINPIN